MSIRFEWCCEVVHLESGDREDLHHVDTFAEALSLAGHSIEQGYGYEIALWRQRYHPEDENDLLDTQYAYLETATGECWISNGTAIIDGAQMPVEFDGGAKVPNRFRLEVTKKGVQS